MRRQKYFDGDFCLHIGDTCASNGDLRVNDTYSSADVFKKKKQIQNVLHPQAFTFVSETHF